MSIRKRIALILVVGIMCILSACQQETDTSFYVKSSIAMGDSAVDRVIDARIDKDTIVINDVEAIPIEVGFGAPKLAWLDGTENTWISVEAEGCIIAGQKDLYQKKYDDFYTNEIYRPTEKGRWFGYPVISPNYFEVIEVIFPQGECVGDVVFTLNNLCPNGHVDIISVSLYYAKTDSIIVFSGEATYDAERKLAALIASES